MKKFSIFFLIKYQSCHQNGRRMCIIWSVAIALLSIYELEPAYGDHTPYEGLVDKTNFHKACRMGLYYTFPHSVDSKLEMWTRL